ncbi:MAG: hypothetical protein R3F43_30725 [bacterium]
MLACLTRLGRTWADQRVALLGVGSVGRAVAGLLARRVGAPGAWTLCDLPARRPASAEFARQLIGTIEIWDADPAPPGAVYDADLIIGASSGAATLAVARLRPGAVVVDDSSPHCFDVAAAWRRDGRRGRRGADGRGLLTLPLVRRRAGCPAWMRRLRCCRRRACPAARRRRAAARRPLLPAAPTWAWWTPGARRGLGGPGRRRRRRAPPLHLGASAPGALLERLARG